MEFESRKNIEEMKKKLLKTLAKHVVEADETLSHIALKYYGSAAEEKWMAIYNANKDVIGDDPGVIKKGMELTIPKLD